MTDLSCHPRQMHWQLRGGGWQTGHPMDRQLWKKHLGSDGGSSIGKEISFLKS